MSRVTQNQCQNKNATSRASMQRGQGRGHVALRTLATLVLSFALVCTLAVAGFAAEAQTVRYDNNNSGNSSQNSSYSSSQGSSYNSSDILMQRIGMGVLTGALVAGVFCFICVRQLKTAVRQHSASDYVTGNGLHLTDRRDLYLFSNTVRRRRENSQGGRGGHGGGRGGPGGFGGGPGFGGGGGPRGGGGRR